jgi:hypothetical protein
MNYKMFAFASCVVAALAGQASAAAVPFDINPDLSIQPAGVIPGGTLIGSPFTYYNIQFDVDGGVPDIQLRTARADAPGGPGVDQVVSDGYNGSSIVTKGANSYINTPFSVGEVIGDGVDEFARGADDFNVIYDGGYQLFAEGTNYLGFRLPGGNYGFVEVNYASATATYSFTGGMYENSGGPIVAGVPEPTALLLAALGGCLGLICRRSR